MLPYVHHLKCCFGLPVNQFKLNHQSLQQSPCQCNHGSVMVVQPEPSDPDRGSNLSTEAKHRSQNQQKKLRAEWKLAQHPSPSPTPCPFATFCHISHVWDLLCTNPILCYDKPQIANPVNLKSVNYQEINNSYTHGRQNNYEQQESV